MRAAFEWLKADFQAFLDREIEKLTDPEIEEYYEANKNSYRKLNLPTAADIEGAADPTAVDPTAADPTAVDPTAADPTAADPTDGAAGASTDRPSSSDLNLGGEQPDGSGAAASEQPVSPAEAAPAVSEGESTSESTTEDSSAAESSECGFQESDEEVEEDEDEQEATAASTEAPSDITPPAPDNPDATEGVSEASDDASETDSDESAQPSVEDADEEIEYQPIEEVRDDIAQQLARPRATEAVRRGKWKLLAREGQPTELFDIEADPFEENSLLGRHPELEASLTAALQGWLAEPRGTPLPQ